MVLAGENITADSTIYAIWVDSLFSITYVLDGGTNNVGNPATIETDELPFMFLEPTKANKAFDGWFSDAELTIPAGIMNVPGDVTIYAKWLDTFTVTYDLNGGNVAADESDIVALLVPEGTLVGSAQPDFTPVFTGKVWTTPYWVTTAIGSTDAASTAVTANVTVYAYWVNA